MALMKLPGKGSENLGDADDRPLGHGFQRPGLARCQNRPPRRILNFTADLRIKKAITSSRYRRAKGGAVNWTSCDEVQVP